VTTQETRPLATRALTWFGTVVLLGIGLPLTGIGLLGVGTPLGRGLLCFGLVLLVCGVGGVAREVVEDRVRRDPPRPRLESLDGRPSLHLPRAPGPTLVSSWILAALGAVASLGAVLAGLEESWVPAGVLLAVAVFLVRSSAIHRGGALAGGLWFNATGFRHEDRGVAVDVPWEAVTGVVPQQPMPVLLRPDRVPVATRTGPYGRAWRPVSADGTLNVDTRHLAGGTVLASYVVGKAVTDPSSRAVLGTPESLPG
jgi:hypothetical protein